MMMAATPPGRFGTAFDWLGVERAWTRTRGSASVAIAIVDEGVQLDHPLLAPNIHRDLAPQTVSADSYEISGTHAAGIAAGRQCEAQLFSGVAPGACLLPVRFTSRSGAQALDLAQAIEYAVEMGACIINVAHHGDLSQPCVHRAIQYAATRNALVVSSVTDDATPAPPELDAPNLVRVLSVDQQCQPLANYSGAAADLAAPGFARVPRWRGNGHGQELNAALGAPHVSGCAALVKSLNPGWGYHEIREHLLASATPREPLAGRCQTGQMLNVANAVLGPIELADKERTMTWSSLNDAAVHWKLRYRSALCVNAVALYRPHGDEHWRELAFARAITEKMVIPAASLRRSSGILRLACRDANFHADDVELTIR
jgi:subtilisin family serine protease